jgi:tetratricopeptide (TPR) repeat protein
MLSLLPWLVLPCWAERPIPDYRDTLQEAAAAEIARIAAQEGPEAAEDVAAKWSRAIGADARLSYELGLAWRLAGDEGRALSHLDEAIELAPDDVAARYDRGEIRLNRGDLAGAREDFAAVVRLAPERWAGHFRMADLAARAGDPEAFQQHLLAALRCGFSFRSVVGDPRWHGYLADPRLGPPMRTLLMVYQDESVLRALEQPPAKTAP